MAEVETELVTRDDTRDLVRLRAAQGESMLERWVSADPKLAIERISAMVEVLQSLRKHAIRETYPSDWVIHVSRDGDGTIIRQAGYLQDSGAERAGKVFGIQIGAPKIRREDFSDGTFAYHMEAEAFSRVTGERIERVEGSRWSGDRFFMRQVKEPGDKVDPTDVSKAAYANLHGRAVRALAGLTAVPLDVLESAGLDTKKCLFVDYEKGAKGGESAGVSVGTADVTIPWGNCKGQKPRDISDKDLDFYIGKVQESLEDPERARFRKSNEKLMAALKAEKQRRATAAEQEAATGTAPPPAEEPGEGAPRGRGKLLGDVQVLLNDATGKNGRLVAGVLRLICRDWGTAERAGLSEFTDEELSKIAAIPADVLKALADQAKKGGAQ